MWAELGTLKRLSHKTTPALPADVRKALGFPENAAIYSGSARYRGEAPLKSKLNGKRIALPAHQAAEPQRAN